MRTRQSRPMAQQTVISAYGRVTKHHVASPSDEGSKANLKRKAVDDFDSDSEPVLSSHLGSVGSRTGPGRNKAGLAIQLSHNRSLPVVASPRTPAETPTRALDGAVKRMKLTPSSDRSAVPGRSRRVARSKGETMASSPSPAVFPNGTPLSASRPRLSRLLESEPESDEAEPVERPVVLPDALVDLLRMVGAVLSAVSLHVAHTGLAAAAPLPWLLETATGMWRRRQVSVDDVQIVIGLVRATSGPFLDLVSIGVGPVVAVMPPSSLVVELGPAATSFDQAKTADAIHSALSARWIDWARQAGCLAGPDRFIHLLPRAEIAACKSASLSSANIRSKRAAHAATELLQAAQSAASRSNSAITALRQSGQPSSSRPTGASLADRQAALVQRVAAHSALQAASAGSADPATRARKAALVHVPAVLRTVRMLLNRDCSATSLVRSGPSAVRPTTFSAVQLKQAVTDGGVVPDSQVLPAIRLLDQLSAGYIRLRQWQGVIAVVVSGFEPTPAQMSSWT